MKSTLTAVLLAAFFLPSIPAQTKKVTCAQTRTGFPIPPLPTSIDSSCAVIPFDFPGVENQGSFDTYSWLTFLALNWPAGNACLANPNQNIVTAPPNPVWLTWLQDVDVFVPKGQTPAKWCFGATAGAERSTRLNRLPPKVKALAQKHPEVRLFLSQSAKSARHAALQAAPNSTIQGVLQSTGDILVDQNGRWTRYTVSMNQSEYKSILSNNLWTTAGQKAAKSISFTPSNSKTGELGAMEIKAAWKVLGPNDNPSHFFTMSAIVYNDVSGDPSPGPNPVKVGLVGFHISHKTALQKTWLWSTFEQIENTTKSFYNASCPASKCPPNTKTVPNPTTAQELNAQGKPNFPPAQVVAVTPTSAQSLNTAFQKLLGNTPWAYYQLISTQWIGEDGNAPKPAQLGNSVQETFVPSSMYSCFNCHQGAQAQGGQNADFSWMLYFAVRQ